MAIYLCHEQPDLYVHDAAVVDSRPGAIALSRSAFHPGGGGQVSDIGVVEWSGGRAVVTGIAVEGERWWHLLEGDALPAGDVELRVDAEHRLRVASLHTASHVLNAFVFAEFAGALVTGAQINGDGTGRMDFDLPGADNDRIRALEPRINELIAQDIPVRFDYAPFEEAQAQHGLIRSRSVAPAPEPDGRIRIVEIVGLDRQACGGTHLASTGGSPPLRILKIDNKGRHNRRVRIGLAGVFPGA